VFRFAFAIFDVNVFLMSATRRTVLQLPPVLMGLAAPALARSPGGAMGRILAAGKLRAGVWLDSAPYGLRGEDGRPSGMEVAVALDIARSLGVTAELVPLDYAERVAAVALGHVDIACAVIIMTPDRLRRVAFAYPHGQITTVLAATGLRPIASLAELSGRRVVARYNAPLPAGRDVPRDVEPVVVLNYTDGLDLLLAGDAAAMILPEIALRRLALQHPEAQLYPLQALGVAPYAVAMPLGEPDLRQFINTWVFLREEDGTLASLHEAFLQSPRPSFPRL
jgi:polar amino acid transport system substrate-binding protein